MIQATATQPSAKTRCRWATREPSLSYHDEEWGVPVHDDHTWFEFITLEGAQAGLSWETILKKRDRYRKVFSNFDPKKVARYDAKKKKSLLADAGIIRNRLKIDSTITNAQAFLKIQKEFGSFDKYIWQFVEGKPLQSNRDPTSKMIVSTKFSDARNTLVVSSRHAGDAYSSGNTGRFFISHAYTLSDLSSLMEGSPL